MRLLFGNVISYKVTGLVTCNKLHHLCTCHNKTCEERQIINKLLVRCKHSVNKGKDIACLLPVNTKRQPLSTMKSARMMYASGERKNDRSSFLSSMKSARIGDERR